MIRRHLFHAVGNCCINCGVSLIASSSLDERAHGCPGGPGTNIVSLSHRIAERKLAVLMQYDRPFRYPPQ